MPTTTVIMRGKVVGKIERAVGHPINTAIVCKDGRCEKVGASPSKKQAEEMVKSRALKQGSAPRGRRVVGLCFCAERHAA
jgi:hypothetical protein